MRVNVISVSPDGERAAIAVRVGARSITVHLRRIAGKWLDKKGFEFPEVDQITGAA